MTVKEVTPGFYGATIVSLVDHPHGLRMTLACGHVTVVSRQRTDLFEAKETGRLVHCWACDAEAARKRMNERGPKKAETKN